MPQPAERGQRLRFRIEQAQSLEGAAVALPPRVSLAVYPPLPSPELQAGQRWRWTVRLSAPHGARNPHGFDWELWMWTQGLQASGYVRQTRSLAPPEYLGQTWRAPVEQLRGRVRAALQQQIQPPAGSRAQASAGVVTALVTGDQQAIVRSDWQLFRDTGTAHLVSISGLHITMFAWLAITAVGWLWRRSPRLCLWWPAPLAAAWSGLALALAYALFSGWGVPAQRSALMLLVMVLLRSSGLLWPWPWPRVWLLALFCVLLWDPWALRQAGFWLSFVAVGILFAAVQRPKAGARRTAFGHLRSYLLDLIRAQWAVGLALAPLTIVLFGQLSVIGLLANLLAIPWVTLVVAPLAMLGMLWAPLWELAALAVSALIWPLERLATWPWAVLRFAQPPWWCGLAAIGGAVWLAMPWPWRLRLLGWPLMLPLLLWQPPRPDWGEFRLLALDVGQGGAVLVLTQGRSLLFDAGPAWGAASDAGARTVQPLLQAWAVSLDRLMISHADLDHAGGALSVLSSQPWAELSGSGIEDLARRAQRPWQPCLAGQRWVWDGVVFKVLHPGPGQSPAPGAHGGNQHSCVLSVQSVGGARALLTGDITRAQEQALLSRGAALRSDLVLVPHHGSATSSSPNWVLAVRPQVAVVQAGYRNRYGHPAPAVTRRYARIGSLLRTTADCGAVHWQSLAPAKADCERALKPRYWQHFGLASDD